MADSVLVPPDHTLPVAFTRAQLDWLPWLEPLMVEALTERHMASLVDAARVKSPYFRLLARDHARRGAFARDTSRRSFRAAASRRPFRHDTQAAPEPGTLKTPP